MGKSTKCAASVLVLIVPALSAYTTGPDVRTAESASPLEASSPRAFPVSGGAVIFTATEVVHSVEPTATGLIQRSSTAGQLSGDLNGSILFNATSVFDFVNGTLVNTGTQFFSGTVAGSGPVILFDDQFRFDIDLTTGETHGTVLFSHSNDAPHKGSWFECELVIVGTGITPAGDLTSVYSGDCIERGDLI